MPETGHNTIYDSQGNLIEDIPFVITDDQLLLRELDGESNSYHTLALQAYRNYASLTLVQKDQVLKFLLGYYLSSAQRLHYFAI